MAKIKGPKKTNRYPDEFKIKAIQLADHPDILAKDVAEDLGIHPKGGRWFQNDLWLNKSVQNGSVQNVSIRLMRFHEI